MSWRVVLLVALVLARPAGAISPSENADPVDPLMPLPFCAFAAREARQAPVTSARGPLVSGVAPMAGHAGDQVTIRGQRLTGAVAIFRELAAEEISSSDTHLTVRVPPSTTGPVVIRTPHGQVQTAQPFVYVLKIDDGVAFPIPVGGGEWFPETIFQDFGWLQNVDEHARFLQRHWVQPLRPQGAPPPSYSLIEANTSPKTCRMCHQAQFDRWSGSLHASAASQLVRFNARETGSAYLQLLARAKGQLARDDINDEQRAAIRKTMDQLRRAKTAQENSCQRCHDPVAENGPWTPVELSRAPEDPAQRPVRDGVQCVVCHVRAHQRFGPPKLVALAPKADAPKDDTPPAHNGFTATMAYEDSRFCAGCHTFTIRIDKGIVGNPFEEWRNSSFAKEGVSCQKCHMPERQHMFRGIHDREMTLSGLTIAFEVKEERGLVTATATIQSTRVGHMFPTYPIPMVHVRLYRSGLIERKPGDPGLLISEHTIGRQVDLSPGRLVEEWDHRIPPGGTTVVTGEFPRMRQEDVTLHIDVWPRDDYEKTLRKRLALAEQEASPLVGKIRDLLAHEEGLRYRLVEIKLPVPAPGASVKKTIREGVWQ